MLEIPWHLCLQQSRIYKVRLRQTSLNLWDFEKWFTLFQIKTRYKCFSHNSTATRVEHLAVHLRARLDVTRQHIMFYIIMTATGDRKKTDQRGEVQYYLHLQASVSAHVCMPHVHMHVQHLYFLTCIINRPYHPWAN